MQNKTTATKVATNQTTEKPKLTPFYVNVPRTNIIAESEKSILIEYDDNNFWLAKKYAKNSEMYKFCDVVQITLFKEWSYEVIEDVTLEVNPITSKWNGDTLAGEVLNFYDMYNFSNLNKK